MVSLVSGTYTPPNYDNVTLTLPLGYIPNASNNVELILDVIYGPCDYTGSGDWEVSFSDNCIITSNVNLGGNQLLVTGVGSFTLDGAIISNYGDIHFQGVDSSNLGMIHIKNGGGFI